MYLPKKENLMFKFIYIYIYIYIYDTRSDFSLTELIFVLEHKLLPFLLQRLPHMNGKMFTFTTGGIVVENIILYNYVYDLFYFILFIYSYDVVLPLML